jgi:hypothetical protein
MRTGIHGDQIIDDTVTGDDVKEETLIDSKIPFSSPSFSASNIHDAIVEASDYTATNNRAYEKTSSVSNTSNNYITYAEWTTPSTAAGDYLVMINFLFKVSSSSYNLTYKITVDGSVVDEVATVGSGEYQTITATHKVALGSTANIKLEFKVEQPYWGVTTGTIAKATMAKVKL